LPISVADNQSITMPLSTIPTTPSEVFINNAITILDEATKSALNTIEQSADLQSKLSYLGFDIERYEETFVALTRAEAKIIDKRENYHAAKRTQETYDLLMRGKEDSEEPASLYWRDRFWKIAEHHARYGVRPAGSWSG
jgi:hypothetical protein